MASYDVGLDDYIRQNRKGNRGGRAGNRGGLNNRGGRGGKPHFASGDNRRGIGRKNFSQTRGTSRGNNHQPRVDRGKRGNNRQQLRGSSRTNSFTDGNSQRRNSFTRGVSSRGQVSRRSRGQLSRGANRGQFAAGSNRNNRTRQPVRPIASRNGTAAASTSWKLLQNAKARRLSANQKQRMRGGKGPVGAQRPGALAGRLGRRQSAGGVVAKKTLSTKKKFILSSNTNTAVNIMKTKAAGAQVAIFTKHFDARSKLSATPSGAKTPPGSVKTPTKSVKTTPGSVKARLNTARGNAKQIQSASRAAKKQVLVNKKRQQLPSPTSAPRRASAVARLKAAATSAAISAATSPAVGRNMQMIGNKLKVTAKANDLSANRDSIFTGKSIQVVAKNNSPKPMAGRGKGRGKAAAASIGRNYSDSREPSATFQSRSSLNRRSEVEMWEDDENESHNQPSLPALPPTAVEQRPTKVVISNLHPKVSQNDIKELFGAIGSLQSARLVSVGTADVIFESPDDAFASYTKYHGRNLDGQPMMCKLALAAEELNRTSTLPQNRTQKQRLSPPIQDVTPLSSSKKPVTFTVKL